jgi:hypothetical protein
MARSIWAAAVSSAIGVVAAEVAAPRARVTGLLAGIDIQVGVDELLRFGNGTDAEQAISMETHVHPVGMKLATASAGDA